MLTYSYSKLVCLRDRCLNAFYLLLLQKIFLDVTRELAKHTNGTVDEVWTYIKDGKLVQAVVLLLAAQEHIRLGPSCKKNGNSMPDGFAIILSRIADHFYSFDLGMGQNEREHEQSHANVKYLSSALLLVNVISQAGKALDEYIRVHSEVPHSCYSATTLFLLSSVGMYAVRPITINVIVYSISCLLLSSFLFFIQATPLQAPHVDVLERVSSILKDFGFCPPEEIINIGNLYCLAHILQCFSDQIFFMELWD